VSGSSICQRGNCSHAGNRSTTTAIVVFTVFDGLLCPLWGWSLVGDRDRLERRRELLIPWKRFYESRFIIKNKATNEFAFLKLHETVVRELGRALVYMDMNHVDNLQEVLRQHIHQHGELADLSERSIVREVCEPLLKLRFKRNPISASEWNALMEPLSN
jgi:hypothetical protein